MNTIITLVALGISTMMLGLLNKKKIIIPFILAGLTIALFFSVMDWNAERSFFNNMLLIDKYSISFGSLMIVSTILIFLLADHYFRKFDKPMEDIYALMIFALVGAIIITMFGNLTMFFVGLEIMSVSLYILVGSKKTSSESNEAAMKYFLLGTFFTGIMLFGIALIYGTVGSFDLQVISDYVLTNKDSIPLIMKTGVVLLLVAMSFKVAAFPFHFWSPDVYHGAPTLITAFMATVMKVAGIAAFYRLFGTTFLPIEGFWTKIIWFLSLSSILVGNLGALYQTQIKRVLAYSSIAHTGYILIAFASPNSFSPNAIFYYSAAYTIATIGAFAVLLVVRETKKDGSILAFNGLGLKNRTIAFLMTLSLISLAGIPPLAGFTAKFYVLASAIENNLIILSIAAIIGSIISVVYYFKIIIAMYMKPGTDHIVGMNLQFKILIVSFLILLIGTSIFPEYIIGLF